MKILFVVEHFPCISETFVLNQITGLIDLGHDVQIYALGKPVLSAIHPDIFKYGLMDKCWDRPSIPANKAARAFKAIFLFFRYFWVAPGPVLRSLNIKKYGHQAASLYLFFSALPFIKNRRKYDFDAVHCHFGDKGVLANCWREIGLYDKPLSVVFHAHEMCMQSDNDYKQYYRPLFSSNALILSISNYWRELLISWGASSDRVIVHRMGVDCNKIIFAPKPFSYGDELRILTVARIVESKGIEYAIRAIAKLKMQYPNISYCIAGDGPLKKPLEELSHDLGLDGIVTFIGAKTQDKILDYLANSHVFLSPHMTASDGIKEGIPVAIMEAMAAGVAVITTRHSGIPELVEDGKSGLLADERDTDGLVTHLKNILEHPEVLSELQINARRKVEEEFNINSLNKELSVILQNNTETIGSSKGRRQ